MQDDALQTLIDDVATNNGVLASIRLRTALANLDLAAARALYRRLGEDDPIAIAFARMPQRAEWRHLLRTLAN